MDVNYGKAVKRYLLKKGDAHCASTGSTPTRCSLTTRSYRRFLFFTNATPCEDHQVEFSFGGTLSEPKMSTFVQLNHLREMSKWTQLPHLSVERDPDDGGPGKTGRPVHDQTGAGYRMQCILHPQP